MVDKRTISSRKVVDFLGYQQQRRAGRAPVLLSSCCRHCGAALAEGESEDECSGAGFGVAQPAPARFRAMPER
jgi:hypothetical protein